ncbi:hypothetical protein AG1IA_00307 [Rhizoctonia solani AG-1 IA]|uniref:Uncharacterized protein n=1 Tax=Thanatephorus cucumeris (strain AG1-IA) TaxID=983506 RepID=L8X996_THACA|nr:hypothetical protein AG1IA_00307 [Rhizoctonia solani AG-1 IA]
MCSMGFSLLHGYAPARRVRGNQVQTFAAFPWSKRCGLIGRHCGRMCIWVLQGWEGKLGAKVSETVWRCSQGWRFYFVTHHSMLLPWIVLGRSRRLWALVLRFKMPGSYEPELSVILTSYTRDGGRRLSAPDSRVLDTLSNDTARTKEETGEVCRGQRLSARSDFEKQALDRELKRENTWARIYLVPLLLAEGDRDAYRREQASLARDVGGRGHVDCRSKMWMCEPGVRLRCIPPVAYIAGRSGSIYDAAGGWPGPIGRVKTRLDIESRLSAVRRVSVSHHERY